MDLESAPLTRPAAASQPDEGRYRAVQPLSAMNSLVEGRARGSVNAGTGRVFDIHAGNFRFSALMPLRR